MQKYYRFKVWPPPLGHQSSKLETYIRLGGVNKFMCLPHELLSLDGKGLLLIDRDSVQLELHPDSYYIEWKQFKSNLP